MRSSCRRPCKQEGAGKKGPHGTCSKDVTGSTSLSLLP
jgi:hypothetical protein